MSSQERIMITMTTPVALKTTTLRAEGFSCPSCVSKIENKLNSMDGVKSSEVKFASGRIIAEHDPQKVTIKDLVTAVADVGYTAKPSMY